MVMVWIERKDNQLQIAKLSLAATKS